MQPNKHDNRLAKANRYAAHLSKCLREFTAYQKRCAEGKCRPKLRQSMKDRLYRQAVRGEARQWPEQHASVRPSATKRPIVRTRTLADL